MLCQAAILILIDNQPVIARRKDFIDMALMQQGAGRCPDRRVIRTGIIQFKDRSIMTRARRKGLEQPDRPTVQC